MKGLVLGLGLLLSATTHACLYDFDIKVYQTSVSQTRERINEQCSGCFSLKNTELCKKVKLECLVKKIEKNRRTSVCQNDPHIVESAWESCRD